MLTRLLPICLLAAAAVMVAACDEKLSDIAGPSPNLEPTLASIQSNVFESADTAGRVACTGCHTNVGRNPSGGLNLVHDLAYQNLVNVPARGKAGAILVVPGDPENSYIIQKMEGRAGIAGRRMPFVGPPFLTDGQILIVRRWIAIGAPR